MINLKKVGLTALAGSLAAVTAQAGELSVTGSANVTYVTNSGGNTAQSLGHDKDVKFSGSGELDNGWTFAIHTLTKDDMTVSSTATVITMGSMGSIGVGSGGGTNVNGGYDEAIPTAYEENSDAGGQGAANYVGSYADGNGVTYQMPAMDVMGATLTGGIDYSFQGGSDSPNDGGAVARNTTWGNAYGVGLTLAYEGLSVGAFVSERENKNITADTTVSDEFTGSWNVKYSMGPVSLGYSEFYIGSGLAAPAADIATTAAKTVGTTSGIFDGDMMSVAFNVNDDLSLSWSEMTATHDPQQHSTSDVDVVGVDEKHESLQMAYSMGAMSIKAYKTEITNPNFDEDAESITKNEIALGLSF
ncbi:porin [Candidatus Pelagibacter sp.]|nr:porin [Candidatus Pelagibacter sp.]